MNTFVYSPSPWIERFDNPIERQMLDGFITVVQETIAEEDLYRKDSSTLYAGMEIEYPLVTKDCLPVPQSVRDEIVARFPHWAKVELGAHQLETVNEPPIDLRTDGIRGIEQGCKAQIDAFLPFLHDKGAHIIRTGCYPLVAVGDVPYTTGDPKYAKYERCPTWHRHHQRPGLDTTLRHTEETDVSNPFVMSLMNAVHVTIDALSFDDAIDKLNRSLMLSPFALALSANAPYLALCNTGYADVRLPAWELSHDTRSVDELAAGRPTRIGLPRRYYTEINEYFNRVLSYPFIMNDSLSLQKPFEVGMGIYWRDARLKFFRQKKTVAVEFRPIALQPSLREDIAMVAFFLGRLFWSQTENEPLLPMKQVWQNRDQAVRYGLSARLCMLDARQVPRWECARDGIERELDRAEAGLESAGVDAAFSPYAEILRARVHDGNPAERFVQTVQHTMHTYSVHHADRYASLVTAMNTLGLIERPEDPS